MELRVEGGEVLGTVQAYFADGHSPLASINGRRLGPFIFAEITHMRHGDILHFGKLRLRFRRKRMQFRCPAPVGDFYPRRASLWHVDLPNE